MANKKDEKVVEEVQATDTKEVKEEVVEKEGGDMKITAKTKKATKPKKLTQQEPTVTKVDLSEKKEEQPKDDNVAKVDLSKKEEEEPKQEVV
jgi:hypothetical protein